MKVLISGGTGLAGTALTSALRARGDEVRILSRSGTPPYRWDPMERQFNPAALDEVDAVVNLAGAPIANAWSDEYKREMWDSRVVGTELLADAMAKADHAPSVFLSGSAVGIYGDRDDQLLTEESSLGDGFLADLGQAWERAAAPARDAGVRTCFLRTGHIMSGKGGYLPAVLPIFKAGVGGPVAGGQQWISWIHIDDWVAAVLLLLDEPSWQGPVNLVSPQPIRQGEQARILGRILGRPSFLPAPGFAIKAFMGERGEHLLLHSTRVQPERLQQAGFEFLHPDFEEAIRQILRRKG